MDRMSEGLANFEASGRGAYSASRAAALSGVPKSTVYDWARKGLVVPSVSPAREKLWSYQDLLALRAVHWLRMRKETDKIPASPMAQVRRVLEEIVQSGEDPWTGLGAGVFVDRDGRIFVDREGDPRTDAYGQGAWDLGDKVNLMAAIGPSPGLVAPSEHIRIAPSRLTGEPHLAGTRIGTLVLAALAADGYEEDGIAGLYGLPLAEVAEALAYEMRLAA
jgi:uncharacterized protein (DUF433 family)